MHLPWQLVLGIGGYPFSCGIVPTPSFNKPKELRSPHPTPTGYNNDILTDMFIQGTGGFAQNGGFLSTSILSKSR